MPILPNSGMCEKATCSYYSTQLTELDPALCMPQKSPIKSKRAL